MFEYDVNVVIVNYKMKEEIEKCLSSLYLDEKQSGLKVNVVIVDNASNDGSKEFLLSKFSRIHFVERPQNGGFGSAQNIGLASAKAKYHFVLNPDIYFFSNENILRSLFDFMEKEPKVGIIGPKLLYPDGTLQYSCYRFPTLLHPLYSRTKWGERGKGKIYQNKLTMRDYDHEKLRPVDWLMGSALFIRGSALDEVGMFDERFWMYYEDSDLCRRFWEKGWGVYYVPFIRLEHVHGRRSAEVSGIIAPLIKNKLARVHVASWLKYMWKWRGNYKYYA